MSDDATQSGVSVPQKLRDAYPVLIALILGSESMNDEERQYWINILPAMSDPQREQLQSILQSEHDQLAAIDAKYAAEIERIHAEEKPVEEIDEHLREKRAMRQQKEEAARSDEEAAAEKLLQSIE